MLVDEFLIDRSVPVSIADLAERYNRPIPDKGEELAVPVPRSAPSPVGISSNRGALLTSFSAPSLLANAATADRIEARDEVVMEDLKDASLEQIAHLQDLALSQVRDRLRHIKNMSDPEFRQSALKNLRQELPAMLLEMNEEPGTAQAMEQATAAALFNGYAKGASVRKEPADKRR